MASKIECAYCSTINNVWDDARTLECAKCGAPLRQNFAETSTNLANLRSFPGRLASVLSAEADSEVEGIDVSIYQGVMNWDVAQQHIQAAYARSSAGNTYIDEQWLNNLTGCQSRQIPIGPYHFCKPDKDPHKSAQNFKDAGEGDLPPCADIETNAGLNKSQLESWVVKFLWRVEDLFGVRPIIYTSAGFWNQFMPRTDWAKNYKLFVAHWTTASKPILPNDWSAIVNPVSWTLWQYSSYGNNMGAQLGAQSRDIDRWRYNGTIAQFNAEFGVGVPLPPPPAPPAYVVVYGVGAGNFLNVRDAVYGNVVAKTWDGARFAVEDVAIDQNGQAWYKIGKTIYIASWYTKPA